MVISKSVYGESKDHDKYFDAMFDKPHEHMDKSMRHVEPPILFTKKNSKDRETKEYR